MLEQSGTGVASVLVIDDNEANRTLARHALEDEGHRVILASSGAEGLAVFDTLVADCVVLDVRMPVMDGFAVCEQLRARGFDTPVIFLTALRDVETFDRALKVGGDDFLTKPVHPAELVIRVQAGLKLRRLRAELREHYQLLRHQRDVLLRLQLQKERLMSFLVHDLKNPVNSMDLQAQMLMRSKDATPSVVERASKIRGEARHLTRMLLNLLDLSKGDEGRLTPRREQVALHSLIRDVVSELEATAQERQVTLDGQLPAIAASLDEDLLRRTLTNLLENAIRHAPPGTGVLVQLASHPTSITLRISDSGPGVPEHMRSKIFDPFVQVDSEDGSFLSRNGRGLGLAFCKLAVEAHDGRIWVEDGNPGAVFCVTIPGSVSQATPEER